jgi:hypothetical protein
MKKLITKLFQSFEANKDGFSGRKISAMVAIVTGIYITVKLIPESAQLHALYAWQMFALVCLGLVTIPELIKFITEVKNGKNETTPTPPADNDSPAV